MAEPVDKLRCIKRDLARWLVENRGGDKWVREHVEVARVRVVLAVKMLDEEDDPDAEGIEEEDDER